MPIAQLLTIPRAGFASATSRVWSTASACSRVSAQLLCFAFRLCRLGQARDVVVKYLQENPAHRHEAGATLVMEALHDAWPCR